MWSSIGIEALRPFRAVLVDRRSVWRNGAHAVWVEDGGAFRIETAKDNRGERPRTGD